MKLACVLVALLVCGAFAFVAPASAPTQTPPPQFKTEVSAVVVDVLVLDKQGQPIPGLKKEDFTVYEDGALQTIDAFDVIDWTSYLGREAPRGGENRRPPAAPAAVNAFPRRFVFVINRQGAKFGFIVRAKKALEHFIVESMAEGDEAMVVDIGLSTKVLQEFKDSKEETLRTVRKLSPMEVEINPGASLGVATTGLEERATRDVYDSLEAVGDALTNFTGRKILILLSPELNRTHNLLSYLQDTVNALNRSNTTVYSIDIRGIETVSAEVGGPTPVDPFGDTLNYPTSSFDSFELGGLFPLADQTGGRYFYNLNTFEPAVQRVGNENQRYYVLTYVPTNTTLDGKYRKIEVKVTRPDVTVVARRGYFARKPKPGKETTDKRTPAAKPAAPRGPSAPSVLRPPSQVEIASYLLPAREGKVEVPIAVALPVSLLQSRDGAPRSANLTLTVKAASGEVVTTEHGEVNPQNFYLVRGALLSPGNYLLELKLESDGKVIHQATDALTVPANLDKRFGLSSIIPVTAPTPGAESPKPASLPLRPSATLSRGEDAFLYFRILPGGEKLSGASTKITFTIFQDAKELRATEASQPVRLTGDGSTGYPIVLRVPTSDLPGGRYRVEVRVLNSETGKRASSEIEITIE